jgi:predicted ATPase
LQTAQEQLPHLADGAWFVSLAALSSPEQVVPAVARALGLQLGDGNLGPLEQLLAWLRGRRLLLLLDNYEHLARAGAHVAAQIAAGAPGVKVLVTSRVRLHVEGEHLFPVLGLAQAGIDARPPYAAGTLTGAEARQTADRAAPAEDAALLLFEHRARAVLPGFRVDETNRADAEMICRLVQGFPLAIELAASWVELLSPGEIAVEIAKNLDFLEAESGSEKRRSIRAVFDSTWRLLTTEEKENFARLSLMRGRFSRQAAEVVAGASLRMLLALSHKSLVYRDAFGADPSHHGDRYAVHELLRQYAVGKLRDQPDLLLETQERLSRWASDRLSHLRGEMLGANQRAALEAVASELPGLRDGLMWAVEQGRRADVVVMLDALLVYYTTRTWRQEASGLMAELETVAEARGHHLSADPELRAIWAALHACHAFYSDFLWSGVNADPDWFAFVRYLPFAEARPHAEQALAALALPGTSEGMGMAVVALGQTVYFMGEQARGLPLLEQGVAQMRAAGDRGALALALTWLASALASMLRLDEAEPLLAEAIGICRQMGNRLQYARLLMLQGTIEGMRTSTSSEGRIADLREALAIFVEMGALTEASFALGTLADEYDSAGDYAAAMRYNAEARAMIGPLNDPGLKHNTLSWEALAASRLGHYLHARACRLESLDLSTRMDDQFLIAWNHWELGDIARLLGELEVCRNHWAKAERLFRTLNVENGIIYTHRGYAELALRQGNFDEARLEYERALQAARTDAHRWSEAFALAGLGRVALQAGDAAGARTYHEQALRLAVELNSLGLKLIALVGLAGVALLERDPVRALELSALAATEQGTWHEFRTLAVAVEAQALQLLPVQVGEAARMRGATGTLESVIESLLGETVKPGLRSFWAINCERPGEQTA